MVSYFEIAAILSTKHAHTAMMGVFGMLSVFGAVTVVMGVGMACVRLWTRRRPF